MRWSGWKPSIVPNVGDQNVYLVLDCFNRAGCAWREADAEGTDLETVISDLMSGQYNDPQHVVAFNTFEHWAEDVSEDVAREIRRRADLAYEDRGESDMPPQLISEMHGSGSMFMWKKLHAGGDLPGIAAIPD